VRLLLVVGAALCALGVAPAASAASSYCSPTGDYCTSTQRVGGAVMLRMSTPARGEHLGDEERVSPRNRVQGDRVEVGPGREDPHALDGQRAERAQRMAGADLVVAIGATSSAAVRSSRRAR
jgi:hypothetical protein